MRPSLFLSLVILYTPFLLAVDPTVPIGKCEIAPNFQKIACSPQECCSSGGWCTFETTTGRCLLWVLKQGDHGVTTPVRTTWARGLKPCAGCYCWMSYQDFPAQSPVNRAPAIASSTLSPVDASLIEDELATATGPEISLEAAAVTVMDKTISVKTRHAIAPYAYDTSGMLIKKYFGVLDAVDSSGARILSKKRAKTLLRKRARERLHGAAPTDEAIAQAAAAMATGSRMSMAQTANLIMSKNVLRKQLHVLAPYAFDPQGRLRREYAEVLDAVDHSGARIIPPKKAKTLASNLQKHPPKTKVQWTGPRKSMAELVNVILNKHITRAQRQGIAPYAFNSQGRLYKEYHYILYAVDSSGAPIFSEEKANSLRMNVQRDQRRASNRAAKELSRTYGEAMTMEQP